TASPDLSTLSLHDALPIFHPVPVRAEDAAEVVLRADRQPLELNRAPKRGLIVGQVTLQRGQAIRQRARGLLQREKIRQPVDVVRSEEHTSELQSRENLVCR